jgi:homoserine kinase
VAARFDPPEGLEAIGVIPADEVSTEKARAAIPESVAHEDAVANVAAASTLLLGLQQADLNLVSRGLHDRLHQPHRASLYPRSIELIEAASEIGALGATISGAGPTVLVWTTWQDTGKVVEQLERRAGDWAEVRRLPFTPLGMDVPEL